MATSLAYTDGIKLDTLFKKALRPGNLLKTAMDTELCALLASGAISRLEPDDWTDYSKLVAASLARKGYTSKVRLVGLTNYGICFTESLSYSTG